MGVELWMESIEHVTGDAAIEAVIDHVPFKLGQVVGVHGVGGDDFHLIGFLQRYSWIMRHLLIIKIIKATKAAYAFAKTSWGSLGITNINMP